MHGKDAIPGVFSAPSHSAKKKGRDQVKSFFFSPKGRRFEAACALANILVEILVVESPHHQSPRFGAPDVGRNLSILILI